jgi:hypothetical protein
VAILRKSAAAILLIYLVYLLRIIQLPLLSSLTFSYCCPFTIYMFIYSSTYSYSILTFLFLAVSLADYELGMFIIGTKLDVIESVFLSIGPCFYSSSFLLLYLYSDAKFLKGMKVVGYTGLLLISTYLSTKLPSESSISPSGLMYNLGRL